MLNSIFSAAKGELTQQLGSKFQLNSQQAEQAVGLTKDTIQSGLLKEAGSGNISGLLNLFNGNSPVGGNPIVTGISNQLVSALTSKLGLSPQVAGAVSTFAVPFIMSKISGNKPSGGFDQSKITEMLGGAGGNVVGNLLKAQGKGIGEKFGKLLK